jgi:hypothetical protein
LVTPFSSSHLTEVYIARLRKLIAEKGASGREGHDFDLEKQFQYHDEDRTGKISPIQFKYIMSEKCGFSQEEYENLANFLDPNDDGEINYTELIKLLTNPDYINQIPVRDMSYIMAN